jgi:integrase
MSPPQAKNKYLYLFDDPDVKRWYDNVSRGSQITADVYLRRLGSFCKVLKTNPKSLASLSELELYNLMLDHISSLEKAGFAGSYIEGIIKAVKSWLSHNGKEINRKIRIRGTRESPSLKDERVPTKGELKRVYLSSDKKTRVSCVLVSNSGVRIEVIGNYTGKDGLTIADLPELKIEKGTVTFERIPTMVVVRRELSKAGHQYLTFLSEEGCEYVKDYLDERLREGEELTSKSPMITPKLKMKPFIRANNVGDNIRAALRAAGLEWRPYVLRCYFDTQMMLAESKGLVLRDYRQFWMGHKGDIENRYTTNKQRLPESVIEDMRSAYERSQEFLQTKQKEEASEKKLRDSFRKQLLLVAGFSQEELDKKDLSSISDEEFQSIVRERLTVVQMPNGSKQKVVSIDEADGYLSNGWEYVAKLSDNKVVIKMNN